MRSAPRDLIAIAGLLLLSLPAAAARRAPPPVPAIALPAAAPVIDVAIAGQALRLTVDFGTDDIVQINPDSPVRAVLAADPRPDGKAARRGVYRVMVGQTSAAIPFTRETVQIAGRAVEARVLVPAAAPPGQGAGSDGIIGLPLLPHDGVTLVLRPATAQDRPMLLPARTSRSDVLGFGWPLGPAGPIDVELHPLRADSVASAAAASQLAMAGSGRIAGPVRRVMIGHGINRPVRQLVLARPVAIAGLPLTSVDVRLFDWAGQSELPPESGVVDSGLTVVGKRGRQRGWPVLKLGADVLGRCASLGWLRESQQLQLTCPSP